MYDIFCKQKITRVEPELIQVNVLFLENKAYQY